MEDKPAKVSPRLKKHSKDYDILPEDMEEVLDWPGSSLDIPHMVRIGIIADGSCFFHCIAMARCVPYAEKKLERPPFIKGFRLDLSKCLADKYTKLSRGNLPDLAKDIPRCQLASLQEEMIKSLTIDNIFNELISDELECDIYILHAEKKDVYIMGKEEELLYKNRPSIVLLYLESKSHYELIGLKDDKETITYFRPDSFFITKIKERIKELRGTS